MVNHRTDTNETRKNHVTDDSTAPARPLCLDQFLKLSSIAESGGQAKVMIQGGEVRVNGEVETRRRRKLASEDVVEVAGDKFLVKEFVSGEDHRR